MNKVDQLVALLQQALPELSEQPEKLSVSIVQGKIQAQPNTMNLSFEYHYQCRLAITEFSAHLDDVVVPMLAWIAEQQPELLTNRTLRDEGFSYQLEHINDSARQLTISLLLSERVKVSNTDQGYQVEHLPEPLLDPNKGIDWQLYIRGQAVEKCR